VVFATLAFLTVACAIALFELCLASLSAAPTSKLNDTQKSFLGAHFLSIFERLPIPADCNEVDPDNQQRIVRLSLLYLQKLSGLLQHVLDKTPPASDALSQTLAALATTCLSFLDFDHHQIPDLAWYSLSQIMQLDFDIVLGMMEHITPRLYKATFTFLQVLVITNFKIRNGVEFIKQWSGMVNTAPEGAKLCDDDLVYLYGIERRG